MLNHLIRKPIRKHLPRQRRYRHACAFALEDVAEVFKVGVAPTDGGGFELEGGDVGSAEDFVGGVHLSAEAVGLGVADLEGGREGLVRVDGG